MTIRLAVREDARAIAEVHVAAWRWAYRELMPREVLDDLSIDRRESQWAEWLDAGDAKAIIFVATDDAARVTGFVAAGHERDDTGEAALGEIYALYQVERAHRTGLGRALVNAAIDALRARGFAACTLWALASNQTARGFYEAVGFALDGATKIEGRFGEHVRYRRAIV